jgi:hexosaminidase
VILARSWLLVACLVAPVAASGQSVNEIPIPAPAQVTWGEGFFPVTATTSLVVQVADSMDAGRLALRAAEIFREAAASRVAVSTEAEDTKSILLKLTGAGTAESYQLRVAEAGVVLTAPDAAGLFHGLETLRQLITPGADSSVKISAVIIEDEPRFGYRGMHLDVGRHAFSVAFIKRYIDFLARYKFNTFHWHLTEDQGWRIEIERYPRLTEVGSCRTETMVEKNFDPYVGDGVRYCGSYSQDDVREIVAYAADRYVTIVPEIEMPGHSLAALTAYPELACTPGPFEVGTRWGVFEDIYCPSETTFEFLENVLREVMDLFPSEFIHIGGDEAPKRRWRESDLAQAVIRREGLEDEHELQSYFIQRIERFLNAHGRRLIGWDEILEGGVAPDATVMSWRGMAGGIEAARQGHDVIMTPGSHVYFDHYQGDPRFEPLAIGGYTPMEKVYRFEPVPEELTATEASHVVGAQANVWTEYITTERHVEYMALPRMLALSEVLWSPAEARDWEVFRRRLPLRLEELDRLGVNYRVPEVEGLGVNRLSLTPGYSLALSTLMPNAVIRYTLDGSDPDTTSARYQAGLVIAVPDEGVTVTARAFLPGGRTSPASAAVIRRGTLRPAIKVDSATIQPGLRYQFFDARLRSLEQFGAQTPTISRERVVSDVDLVGDEPPEGFAVRLSGLMHVATDGVYQFELLSDDGSRLWLADTLVVDHDGLHSARAKHGMVALAAGYHTIRIEYFQAGGGKALGLRVREDGGTWGDVTGRVFSGR